MVDITKPVYGDVWANTGEKLAPDSAKIATGWIQEMMPYQYENFLQNRADTAITYLLQKGVSEWSSDQEYIANKSVVTYGANLYIAIADNTNVLPTVNTSWRRLTVTIGTNGAIPVSFGGTGATTAADARTNLGLGTIATAVAPTSNGVVVRSAVDTLISRSITGTANNIVVTNGDGVAGNITIDTGSNVALLNTDSSWTSTGSIRLPSGSTSQQGTSTPGRVRFNLETDEFHGAYSDGWKVLAKPASAEQTPITDVGNFYTSSNTEGALQEVGLKASFVKDAILSYSDYSTASAAAATLPDGQVVEAPDAGGIISRYDVLGGVLVNQRLASDASSTSFTQAGAGAAPTSVQRKLREGASIKDFGGVGDGVALDQDAVDSAIASGFESLLVNDDAKFLVTSLVNTMGVDLGGYGHIVKAITGGLQKLNSYADRNKYVFGTEYLAAFHNLLIAQTSNPTRKPIMVFSGDSTTAGDGVSPDYQIHALMKSAGGVVGLQTPYGLSSINRGLSGAMTGDWATTYVNDDLAQNPDLLVLRWGINDPGYLKDGSTPPPDAGQAYPNRRDALDYITSLRLGLSTIRASRGLSSLSIVLMTPNSTSDTPNGRDELWYEQIAPGIKQAARDFQCVFIDTYAYLRDSRPAAGVWMDNPFSDGRAIHPANVMNVWISGLMASAVFPEGLRHKIGVSSVTNQSGAEDVGDVARLPSYYRKGITIGRAYATSTAWPLDGTVITIKSVDDNALQINYPYRTADRTQFYFRMGGGAAGGGGGDSWGSWISSGGGSAPASQANVTPSSDYTIPATGQARAVKEGNQVICEGYITKTSPGSVAANTIIATLPAGFRPVSEAAYWNAVIWDGAAFAYVVMRVQPDGSIAFAQNTPINMSRIWLNVNFSTLA